jgi:hypothetical protein
MTTMKNSRKRITCGDFKALRKIVALTGVRGEWNKGEDHCQFRADNGAVLNYWKKKGTIYFQGSRVRGFGIEGNDSHRSGAINAQGRIYGGPPFVIGGRLPGPRHIAVANVNIGLHRN